MAEWNVSFYNPDMTPAEGIGAANIQSTESGYTLSIYYTDSDIDSVDLTGTLTQNGVAQCFSGSGSDDNLAVSSISWVYNTALAPQGLGISGEVQLSHDDEAAQNYYFVGMPE